MNKVNESTQSALATRRVHIVQGGLSLLAWPLVLLLLAVELFFLGERFETARLAGRSEWWTAPLRLLPFLLELGACWFAAAFALGRSRIAATARELLDADPDRRGLGLALCAHGASLAAVTWLLGTLIDGSPAPLIGETPSALLLLAVAPFWLLTGLAVASPASRIFAFAAHERRSVLGGLLLGSLAFALAQAFVSQDELWRPLSLATVEASAHLLHAFGQTVVLDRNDLIVGTPEFSIVVTRFVSGYESVGLFAIFSATLGLALVRRVALFRFALLILAGSAVVWIACAARIAGFVAMGEHVSADLALSAFHTRVGWLPLIAGALGLIALAVHHPAFARNRSQEEYVLRSARAHLTPLAILLAVGFAAGALTRDPRGLIAVGIAFAGVSLFRQRGHREPLFAPGPLSLALAIPFATVLWVALVGAQGGLELALAPPRPPAGFDTLAYLLLTLLGTTIVVPIAQELALRGYLQRRLQDEDFDLCPQGQLSPVAVLVPAFLFGLMSSNFLAGFFLSLVLSGATSLRGRLSDAVFLHVGVRFALVLVAFASGHHELWTRGVAELAMTAP